MQLPRALAALIASWEWLGEKRAVVHGCIWRTEDDSGPSSGQPEGCQSKTSLECTAHLAGRFLFPAKHCAEQGTDWDTVKFYLLRYFLKDMLFDRELESGIPHVSVLQETP